MSHTVEYIFQGARTHRFHTKSLIHQQNVAAHSFGVAWLLELFMEGNAPKHLIMAALAHDLAEQIVGDIPAPVKRQFPEIGAAFDQMEMGSLRRNNLHYALNESEKLLLGVADCMEGAMYCLHERRMGNRTVTGMFARYCSYCEQAINAAPLKDEQAAIVADEILDYILTQWKDIHDE